MRVPVADDAAEALRATVALGALAVEQRDLLGVLAHPHQVEAEIGLAALLLEIETDQRVADPMRQHGAEDRVDQRGPDQIAGNVEGAAEQMQRRRRPTGPTG